MQTARLVAISGAVEGLVDEAVLHRLVAHRRYARTSAWQERQGTSPATTWRLQSGRAPGSLGCHSRFGLWCRYGSPRWQPGHQTVWIAACGVSVNASRELSDACAVATAPRATATLNAEDETRALCSHHHGNAVFSIIDFARCIAMLRIALS